MSRSPEIHSIRLHGPWVARAINLDAESGLEQDTEQRVTIPTEWNEWPGRGFRGQIEYRRSFRMPTGLDDHQRVLLVVALAAQGGAGCCASISLNGDSVGSWRVGEPGIRVEVRNRLQVSNRLTVGVEFPVDAVWVDGDGIVGVRLEIEAL